MATKITREEAINIVLNIYQTDNEKEALEILIPDLAESEDERIRKRLIEYFEGFSMGNAEVKWEGLNVQEVLVWLEKQKEQKHPNGCFTCDEYKKGYEEGRRNGFTAGYNKAMKEVEQKEQKPADNPKWAELTWKDINELERIINNVHYEFQNGIGEDSFGELVLERFREYKDDGSMDEQKQEKFPPYVTGFKGHPDPAGTSDLEEAAEKYIQGSMCDLDDGPTVGLAKEAFIAGAEWQKEQKPAEWSEEDETAFGDLMWCINQAAKSAKDENDMGNIWFAENWVKNRLKSLRPQPKQEWSEEDEKDMAHIIRILDDCYVYGTHDLSKTDHENLVNKLKSLRPSWKPSEEQMNALYDILLPAATVNRLALESLYEQLKAL